MNIITIRNIKFEEDEILVNGERVGDHSQGWTTDGRGRFSPDTKFDVRNGGKLKYTPGYCYDAGCYVAKAYGGVYLNDDRSIAFDATGLDLGWCIMVGDKYQKLSASWHLHTWYTHAKKYLRRSDARAVAKEIGGRVVKFKDAKAAQERAYKVENGIHNLLRAVSSIFYALEQGETPTLPINELKHAFDGLRAAGKTDFDIQHHCQHWGLYQQVYAGQDVSVLQPVHQGEAGQ
jgi:hypothetical protein